VPCARSADQCYHLTVRAIRAIHGLGSKKGLGCDRFYQYIKYIKYINVNRSYRSHRKVFRTAPPRVFFSPSSGLHSMALDSWKPPAAYLYLVLCCSYVQGLPLTCSCIPINSTSIGKRAGKSDVWRTRCGLVLDLHSGL
jgi:hypothetical protein